MKICKHEIDDLIINAVQLAYKNLQSMAQLFNISSIQFSLHKELEDFDIPSATFNNDEGKIAYEDIKEIAFNDNEIVIVSENFSGYIDKYYGDYFDVAHSIGKIYAAVATIINNDDLKPIEIK